MYELILSKEFFQKRSILEGMKDFSNLGTLEMQETQPSWKIIFSACRYDSEKTMQEFENYLIDKEVTQYDDN